MLGLLDPGDEIVVFEPFYENYGPDAILAGAIPRYVTLHEPDWSIDPDELRAAFGPRTRAIVVNSPHNPTGKVFTRAELELIAGLCLEFDALAFTDDIYEHIVFEGEHIPLATLPGMAERTVSIHSMSKTYSVTGWRIGWTIAAAGPVGRDPAGPRLPDRRRRGAAPGRGRRRARLPGRATTTTSSPAIARGATCCVPALRTAGFRVHRAGRRLLRHDRHRATWPTDGEDDVAFALRLIRDPGVAAVPGSSFFSRPELGRTKLRFAFPKRTETLLAATDRLARLAVRV